MAYIRHTNCNATEANTMACKLDLDFFAAEGKLQSLRAQCEKARDKYKRADIKAHYQAVIDAIDARP